MAGTTFTSRCGADTKRGVKCWRPTTAGARCPQHPLTALPPVELPKASRTQSQIDALRKEATALRVSLARLERAIEEVRETKEA